MYETGYPTGAPRKVRALLMDGANLVLLRRVKPNQPAYHVTAGGTIERGERKPAALRRELREELDATVHLGRPFFTVLDTTYYVASLVRLGPNPFTGPEFSKKKNGSYFIDSIPLTAITGGQVDLRPAILPELLRVYAAAVLAEAARLR